ncbi:Periplasmic trehalase [Komagataeibacter saccharivorans]|nr:Periplasmic trehalase [Komagataeibacter saccharivorans]
MTGAIRENELPSIWKVSLCDRQERQGIVQELGIHCSKKRRLVKISLLCGSSLSRSLPRHAGLLLAGLLYAGTPALAQTEPAAQQATSPAQPSAAVPSAPPAGAERTAAAPSATVPAPTDSTAATPAKQGEQTPSVPTPEPLSGSGTMPSASPVTTPAAGPASTDTPPVAPSPATADGSGTGNTTTTATPPAAAPTPAPTAVEPPARPDASATTAPTAAARPATPAPATPMPASGPTANSVPAAPGNASAPAAAQPAAAPPAGQAQAGSTSPAPKDAAQAATTQPHAAGVPLAPVEDLRPPSIALDGLFQAIGEAHIYTDAKTAADAIPDEAPADLLAEYKIARLRPDFSLKDFVAQHFTLPERKTVSYQRSPDENVRDYINGMWEVLSRPPDMAVAYSSQLPLPYTYVVPGGRFSELYYWDSYFTMIGLYENQKIDLMRDMVRDMAAMIDRYGHIPNGSRTYYLSRSEPPFFSLMVDLLAMHDGQLAYTTFLPELQAEYDYWMDGQDSVPPGGAYRRVVRLPDGTVMNRHWDDRDTPRDESYPQDVATAAHSDRPKEEVYRDLRAGSETGWDFSSRWLADGHTLSTIHTTDLLTVELNCLIPHLQQTLAHAYELKGDKEAAARYARLAEERIEAVRRVLWDERRAAYIDYDWKKGESTSILSGATVMPLFLQMATPEQAKAVSETVRKNLLQVGGLIATERTSGQQWDAPNGWAPLQWMAVKGFNEYGYDTLASDIAARWMGRVIGTYEKSGVLLEKYDVVNPYINPKGGKGGGEYPMQIGFGWTNGTLLGFMNRYPQNTRVVLDRNPAADQPSPQPLPPMNAYGVQTDADTLSRYSLPTLDLTPRPVAPTPALPQMSTVGASAPTSATQIPAPAPVSPPAQSEATPAATPTTPAQQQQDAGSTAAQATPATPQQAPAPASASTPTTDTAAIAPAATQNTAATPQAAPPKVETPAQPADNASGTTTPSTPSTPAPAQVEQPAARPVPPDTGSGQMEQKAAPATGENVSQPK